MSNPRKAAFQTLLRIEKERSYADILIDLELRNGKLEGADRGLFTELVYGVLRRKGTLDYIVSNFSERPLEKLERNVLLLLRLGLYQMFFLDRIPVSAAVNETVNLAKEFAPRASGFINGVLRSADCGRSDIKYPDKKESPAKFLSVAYSHPEWITEEWIKDLGIEEAEKLAKTMSQPPTLTLRVNRLKTNRESLLSTLKEEGVEGVSSEWSPEGIAVTSSISLPQMKSFNDGLFVVQDEASQLAVKLLNPKPSESVLDLCAAPGGKTTYIAQLMDNRGHVLACDIGERKLGKIQDTAQRLG
ncbi:MAG: 16S rRNA (cytosine(967)-C(5))-methyltransferase RsmB, partial [Desulfuromonadales bacterium]|nr:16S rRNA (cytosine(967)-C(5))-methyltransferase RsmB [Desulfuromonadales bacterium]